MDIFGEKIYGWLAVFHSVAAFALVISLVMGIAFLYLVSEQNWRHIRNTGLVASLSYIVTFLFGWAVYPLWRVDVRAKIFDKEIPVGTGLFEIKEHLAALGLFAALVVLVLSLTRLASAPATRKTLYSGAFAIMMLLGVSVMTLAFAFSRLY